MIKFELTKSGWYQGIATGVFWNINCMDKNYEMGGNWN